MRSERLTPGVRFFSAVFAVAAILLTSYELGARRATNDPSEKIAEALLQTGFDRAAGARVGDFSFFTYRRSVWVVNHAKGSARFFRMPEGRTDQDKIERSDLYEVDREVYPIDQVRYQVSERNLTNFLWVMNPVTGRGHFVRARRDGGFDESPIFDADM